MVRYGAIGRAREPIGERSAHANVEPIRSVHLFARLWGRQRLSEASPQPSDDDFSRLIVAHGYALNTCLRFREIGLNNAYRWTLVQPLVHKAQVYVLSHDVRQVDRR